MEKKGSLVRITSLLWGDILVSYAFFVMQNYLTDVWGISFTHAAGILNIWGGICLILPCFFLYIVDQLLDHFWMLMLSSVSYSVGILLVAMSTPPVLANSTGTCKQYEPNCIGHTQKVLFYTGMALIAVGISGNKVSFYFFLGKNQPGSLLMRQIFGYILVVVITLTGAIALPYIEPWTVRFWIPAVCTVVGMFMFLSGSPWYNEAPGANGSPLSKVFWVFVASAKKRNVPFPLDATGYRHDDRNEQGFRHTKFLRCLEKAAIIANPDKPIESVCTVGEVEDAKIAVRMIPMWITFLICGIVASIGKTYFIEQANHMNRKIGKWSVPLQMILFLSEGVRKFFEELADSYLFEKTEKPAATRTPQPLAGTTKPVKKFPRRGNRAVHVIGLAMIFSILCCITAARIEKKRIGVIRRYDLLEKPEDDIPMSVFWLLVQFFLLAGLDSFLRRGLVAFYADQASEPMPAYLDHFASGVYGLGFMSSVLSVYVVGRISARRGRTNCFQFTLHKSRLDKYYWVLAGMSAVNFVIYVVVAWFYRYREQRKQIACKRAAFRKAYPPDLYPEWCSETSDSYCARRREPDGKQTSQSKIVEETTPEEWEAKISSYSPHQETKFPMGDVQLMDFGTIAQVKDDESSISIVSSEMPVLTRGEEIESIAPFEQLRPQGRSNSGYHVQSLSLTDTYLSVDKVDSESDVSSRNAISMADVGMSIPTRGGEIENISHIEHINDQNLVVNDSIPEELHPENPTLDESSVVAISASGELCKYVDLKLLILHASLLEQQNPSWGDNYADVDQKKNDYLLLAQNKLTNQECGLQGITTGKNSSSADILWYQLNNVLPPEFLIYKSDGDLPTDNEWSQACVLILTGTDLASLPSIPPHSPNLVVLFLQSNNYLFDISPSFFERMRRLHFLDLSGIRSRTLPNSIFNCTELQVLLLKNCIRLNNIPAEIERLHHMEVLDLLGTELYSIPHQLGKLVCLRDLQLSLYGPDNESDYVHLPSELIPRGVLSKLTKLQALIIAVHPEDRRWKKMASKVMEEIIELKRLIHLQYYFPEIDNLQDFVEKSPSWNKLMTFKFVVGQDVKRVVPRVPDGVESTYDGQARCLRYVNGNDIPLVIEKVLKRATAFCLDHHINANSLSQFGVFNLQKLKFCFLRECFNINVIIDHVNTSEDILPSLEYLEIHYLWNLQHIWNPASPIANESFVALKRLAVYTCPELQFVLHVNMLKCLSNLEELVVEDCESLTKIIEGKIKEVIMLPKLGKLQLSYLPQLVSLGKGMYIAEEQINVNGCPNFILGRAPLCGGF